MDDDVTPRSGRKKKSSLSRLAAKKRIESEESESGSGQEHHRSSYNTRHNTRNRYREESDEESEPQRRPNHHMSDSDEGIAVDSHYRGGGHSSHSPSRSGANSSYRSSHTNNYGASSSRSGTSNHHRVSDDDDEDDSDKNTRSSSHQNGYHSSSLRNNRPTSNYGDRFRSSQKEEYERTSSRRGYRDSDDDDEDDEEVNNQPSYSSRSSSKVKDEYDLSLSRRLGRKSPSRLDNDDDDSNNRYNRSRLLDNDDDNDNLKYNRNKTDDSKNKLSSTFERDREIEELRNSYRSLLSNSDLSESLGDASALTSSSRRKRASYAKGELDTVEEADTGESNPDLNKFSSYSPPRQSSFSPSHTTSRTPRDIDETGRESPFRSYNKQWSGASDKFDTSAMSNLSQVSTTSSAMPLISVKQVRNRSFLVGSMTSSGSLLGTEELERYFPDRKLRVFCGTWNMCEGKVPESLDDFVLPESTEYVCDMYVIGTQESCGNRRAWEIKVQETLGPQHVLYHSGVHGVLYLLVFLRRDLAWFCSVSEDANVSTRAFSNIKTKGVVGVCFNIFGTSLLFVNCHFTPHDGNYKARCADFIKCCKELQLPKKIAPEQKEKYKDDVTARFDVVFWLGDTNYRIQKERARVESLINGIDNDVRSYDDLLAHDELSMARMHGEAFQDFQEGRIKFKPSYKYDIGTNDLDSSKSMKIPSYCDRILFRCRKKHAATCLMYDSAYEMKNSDHKPVFGVYEVVLRPGRDNVPLNAGQYNKEVWLEGNTKRALSRDAFGKQNNQKQSSVCSIQ